MKTNLASVVAAASLGMILAAATAAADDKEDKDKKDADEGGTTSCVQLSRVRNTTVIDDSTILFQLRNGDILLNHLPNRCPTLGQEKRFSYRVTANRLCDTDTITVLQDFGLGLGPSATCQLGEFNPITKEAAEDLKAGPHKSLIESEQVEPIKKDDTAKASGASGAAGDESASSGSGDPSSSSEAVGQSSDAAAPSSDKASDRKKREHKRSRNE
ncbi:MAG TPA: DUF6491 family protein [Gammaproteobacteria bacterium]|nr:DUF6491 family protein [Gammaproteobacteria bacterium]